MVPPVEWEGVSCTKFEELPENLAAFKLDLPYLCQ